MMPSVPPSEILSYSSLRPEFFGVLDGEIDGLLAVDYPGNPVSNTCGTAYSIFTLLMPSPSDLTRAKLALIYYSLSLLYGLLADEKAMYVGLITQRGGQVSTPLGSHAELMKAAERNYQNAQNLYPDVDWPPFSQDMSGGYFEPKRVYGS